MTIVTSRAARKTPEQSEIMMRAVCRVVRWSSGDLAPPAPCPEDGAASSLGAAACSASVPAASAAWFELGLAVPFPSFSLAPLWLSDTTGASRFRRLAEPKVVVDTLPACTLSSSIMLPPLAGVTAMATLSYVSQTACVRRCPRRADR